MKIWHCGQVILKKINIFNLNSNIRWLGFISSQDLSSFYGVSDLFILPSLEEAFGIAAVEAMAYGVPVVLSKKVPIWKEVVDHHAGLVADLFPRDIAGAIKTLLADMPSLKLFSKNARETIERSYNINRIVPLMLKAYEDILSGKRSEALQWK